MSDKRVVAVLTGVRALIADPAHWTKGVYARAANGRETLHDSEDAVCWCLVGAIKKVGGYELDREIPPEIINTLCTAGVGNDETAWNDAKRRTHPRVIATIDLAITLAGAAP